MKLPSRVSLLFFIGFFAVGSTALGYYYEKGTKNELGKLSHLEGDHSKTPTCAKDADGCEWK